MTSKIFPTVIILSTALLCSCTSPRNKMITNLLKRPDVALAAKQAVLCLGWPEGVQESLSKIRLVKSRKGDSMETLNLPTSSISVVSAGCGEQTITVFRLSEVGRYVVVPYSASVYATDLSADKYLYLLFLSKVDDRKKEFVFYGAKYPFASAHNKPMAPVDRYTVSFTSE